MPRGVRLDLTGHRFGRLVAVSVVPGKRRRLRWVCECDCGATAEVASASLRSGDTQSCGCRNLDAISARFRKHGESKGTAEYSAWAAMRRRCHDTGYVSFADYGGRGITVCERWRNSFENFLADMGRKPSPKHSIDRIDNDGNYEPSNCRWATAIEQARNRRSTVMVTANGRTMTAAEWGAELGVNPRTIAGRLQRGWSHDRTINEPFGSWPESRRAARASGQLDALTSAA